MLGTVAAGTATVTNHAESRAELHGVIPIRQDGSVGQLVSCEAALERGAVSPAIPVPAGTAGVAVDYRLPGGGTSPLPKHLVVLDDLYSDVTIAATGSVFAAGVERVEGRARLAGSDGALSFRLEPGSRQVSLLLPRPVSAAAADPAFVLHLELVVSVGGTPVARPDVVRDLRNGVVIMLTDQELDVNPVGRTIV